PLVVATDRPRTGADHRATRPQTFGYCRDAFARRTLGRGVRGRPRLTAVAPWAIAAYLALRWRLGHASRRRLAAVLLSASLVLVAAAPAVLQPRASAAGLKVVLIVGPVESLTSTYR